MIKNTLFALAAWSGILAGCEHLESKGPSEAPAIQESLTAQTASVR
jgi:hypothetical protein